MEGGQKKANRKMLMAGSVPEQKKTSWTASSSERTICATYSTWCFLCRGCCLSGGTSSWIVVQFGWRLRN